MLNRLFTLMLILVLALTAGCGKLSDKPDNEISIAQILFDISSYVEEQMIFQVWATRAPEEHTLKPSLTALGREFYTLRIHDGESAKKAYLNKATFRDRAGDLAKLKDSKITVLATIYQHPIYEDMEIYVTAYAEGWKISESWNMDMKNKLLDFAVTRNKLELAEELLQANTDANYVREGEEFYPMVIIASDLRFYDMLELLHTYKADLNAREYGGLAALHHAAIFDNATGIDVLVNLGADIEIRDSRLGGTPLHWAANNNSYNAASQLISIGVNTSATTSSGMTALELAEAAGSKAVANLLGGNFAVVKRFSENGKVFYAALDSLEIGSIISGLQNYIGAPATEDDIAILETSLGTIKLRLFTDVAPKHSDNFKRLANYGFYDGTTFHRVVPGFVIQGGDLLSRDGNRGNDGQGGPGYTLEAEFNTRIHRKGILAMARGSDPNSAGSQFYIALRRLPNLDNQYTVFGEVVVGMDVVDAIVSIRTDAKDSPVEPVVILNAFVSESLGSHY